MSAHPTHPALISAVDSGVHGAIWLEEVGTRKGEGAVGAFAFGRGFGQIEGMALGVPADKGSARARAWQLWPDAATHFARVKDDGRAEAALLGLYGTRQAGVA